MKTIDLNWKIKDLDGKEIDEALASKLMANFFLQQKNFDAVKLFDWAIELNKKGKISVDESDLIKIKEMVRENNDFLVVITKAQLIKYFNGI